MLPVLAKVTERTKKKIEPFEKNQKDNFIINRKITNCCYIKIYVISTGEQKHKKVVPESMGGLKSLFVGLKVYS